MPSITIWNRLEPRCRTQDVSGALAAAVYDPLWLLARQWQVGEFAARDTGSPLTAQVQFSTASFDRFQSGTAPVAAYDGTQPLESLVEREAVRPLTGAVDLRQATEAGLQFLRLLDAANLSRLRAAYVGQYPLAVPPDADADTLRFASVVAGRAVDGIRLRADLGPAADGLPALPALSAADSAAVLPVAQTWITWFDSLFSELATADSWSPARMEYGFAIGAAGDANGLAAQEYDGGAVDWYTFDRSSTALPGGTAQPTATTRQATLAPVVFRGMPARRFWEIEDAAVNIGALTAGADDLGRMILREFALIYGNDWFQVPLAVPAGCQVTITSLNVADTFGITTTIPHYATVDAAVDPAAVDPAAVDAAAGSWRMFALGSGAVATTADQANLLVITPSAVAGLHSAAIEDVLMLRDELAEMAWGVERTVVGASGFPLDRGLAWRTSQPPAMPPSADGLPKYELGSTVPDYWIPFLPVAVDSGPLQLRRGVAHGRRWSGGKAAGLPGAHGIPRRTAVGRCASRTPLSLRPRSGRLDARLDRTSTINRPGRRPQRTEIRLSGVLADECWSRDPRPRPQQALHAIAPDVSAETPRASSHKLFPAGAPAAAEAVSLPSDSAALSASPRVAIRPTFPPVPAVPMFTHEARSVFSPGEPGRSQPAQRTVEPVGTGSLDHCAG